MGGIMQEGCAKEILKQLGGNHFLVMTDAKVVATSDKSIMFSLPRNMSKANRFEVTLDGDDTYTVKFLSTTRNEPIVYRYSGLYFDMLQSTFTRITGFDTHL